MAWFSGKKIAGGGDHPWREEPDSKRRKVDEKGPQVEQTETQDVNDDEWGDEEYTQDQLEELALLDSQVSLRPHAPAVATTAKQPNVSFVTPVGASRKSTSSSSNSSALPQSLSSSRSANETSGSLSSHSSSNGKLDQSIEPVHALQARLAEVKRKAQDEKNCYDGQVRTLREKLHKQEEELERLRAVRDENYEQQKQVLTEENRKLKSQLDSLSTQACFKDKECQNLQEKCAVLQQKLRKIEQQQPSTSGLLDVRLQLSPKPGSPRKVTVQPSPPSKQRQQEDSASSRRTGFPTTQTFMQQTSPVSNVSPDKIGPSSTSKMSDKRSGRKPVQRRLLLNVGSSQVFGELSGPEIVRHLFQLADLETGSDVKQDKVLGDAGLSNLLQDMSTSLKIAGLTYSREKDSHFLIPQRPKKHTQESRLSNMDTSDEIVQIVSRQNVQLAIEGISQLLQDTNSSFGTAVRHNVIMTTQPGLTPAFSAVNIGSCRSSSSSNVETETEQSKKTPPSADADDEYSTSSSEVRIIKTGSNQSNQSVNSSSSHLGTRVSSSLFHLVLRLAGQDLQDGQSNAEVVNLALRILTCLCEYSTKEELPKLEPIITREILAKCFRQTGHKSVLIHTVRLLQSLVRSEPFLAKLCTKSDSCPLYLMNRACSMKVEGDELQNEFVTCLASIISERRSGLHFLLSNACPCTDKLVASVVLMLYNLFSTYSTTKASSQLHTLHTLVMGINLVHTLAQADNLFAQHCGPVRPQYVILITGLSSILKSDPKTWERHLSVIDELNEFESDSSDTSQESGDEDKMDQSLSHAAV